MIKYVSKFQIRIDELVFIAITCYYWDYIFGPCLLPPFSDLAIVVYIMFGPEKCGNDTLQ